VFQRFGPNSYEGVFVVNLNGTGLKRILPPTMQANCCTFSWSPQGNEIAFVRSHSNDVDGEIYTVNVDGTGLTQITHAPGSNSPDWGTHPPVG